MSEEKGKVSELTKELDRVYNERNMLALYAAVITNKYNLLAFGGHCPPDFVSGWYEHPEMTGFSRVISIDGGNYTFHVPDDFDIGELRKIKPNWHGTTTEEKWNLIAAYCGAKPKEEFPE